MEMNYRLLAHEYEVSLNDALQTSSAMKTQITSSLKGGSLQSLEFEVKINNILLQSEQAKYSIESIMSQSPAPLMDLISQREKQIRLIKAELSSLKEYKASILKILTDIDDMEKRHKNVLHSVEDWNFFVAYTLLGSDAFDKILCEVGIIGCSSSSIFGRMK